MVSLKLQKRLAALVMKCGKGKVWLDPNELTRREERLAKGPGGDVQPTTAPPAAVAATTTQTAEVPKKKSKK